MKQRIIKRPVKMGDINFDELYEEISKDWRGKGQKLQDRRWEVVTKKHDEVNSSAHHVIGTKLWLIRI